MEAGGGNSSYAAVYRSRLKTAIANAPRSLGSELGRKAIVLNLSVIRIAKATGATRQTVYNWFTGAADVSPAYEEKARALFKIMAQANTAEEAWTKACQIFQLHT